MAITVDTTEENLKTTMDNLFKKKNGDTNNLHTHHTHSYYTGVFHMTRLIKILYSQ